ncbi:MAG: glutathione S-transferase family protein [Alphaproteobacteria bacterium]|nr:glutathione S-transferase family protein [Alphaproteobacteria bacterium]
MSDPILFGSAYSVYTRTARLTLAEKGVDYRFDEVDIFAAGGPPATHLARHPFGKIPAFEHGELRLYETAAICRYVDEAFEGPALQPATSADRAVMAQAIGICDSYLYRAGVWDIYVERMRVPARGGTADEAKIAAAIPTVRKALSELARLSAGRPFIAGPDLSLADLHAYPMLTLLRLAPEGRDLIMEMPAIESWHQRMATRANSVKTRFAVE